MVLGKEEGLSLSNRPWCSSHPRSPWFCGLYLGLCHRAIQIPTPGWEAQFIRPFPLKLHPSGRLLIMKAGVASVELGGPSRRGSGGSGE